MYNAMLQYRFITKYNTTTVLLVHYKFKLILWHIPHHIKNLRYGWRPHPGALVVYLPFPRLEKDIAFHRLDDRKKIGAGSIVKIRPGLAEGPGRRQPLCNSSSGGPTDRRSLLLPAPRSYAIERYQCPLSPFETVTGCCGWRDTPRKAWYWQALGSLHDFIR